MTSVTKKEKKNKQTNCAENWLLFHICAKSPEIHAILIFKLIIVKGNGFHNIHMKFQVRNTNEFGLGTEKNKNKKQKNKKKNLNVGTTPSSPKFGSPAYPIMPNEVGW